MRRPISLDLDAPPRGKVVARGQRLTLLLPPCLQEQPLEFRHDGPLDTHVRVPPGSPQLLETITNAAGRGVDVKLILPSFSDFWAVFHAGRSYYAALLGSGVKIFERRAALLHAKSVVVDGVWSTIGSTNMDPRSFAHNDEINAVVLGRGFARQVESMFQRDLAQSTPVTLEQWQRRPVSVRLKEWLARWWGYWL